MEGLKIHQQKKVADTIKAHILVVEAIVAMLSTSMEENLQGFVAYNIGINQSFEQFNIQLGDLVTYMMAMEEEKL